MESTPQCPEAGEKENGEPEMQEDRKGGGHWEAIEIRAATGTQQEKVGWHVKQKQFSAKG